MNILWIDDNFSRITGVLHKQQEDILYDDNGVEYFAKDSNKFYVPRNFDKLDKALRSCKELYDFFILDIDLTDAGSSNDSESGYGEISKTWKKWLASISEKKLDDVQFKKNAGFHIYNFLSTKGVPNDSILFYTGNPDIYEQFKSKFESYEIPAPMSIIVPHKDVPSPDTDIDIFTDTEDTLASIMKIVDPIPDKQSYLKFRRMVINLCDDIIRNINKATDDNVFENTKLLQDKYRFKIFTEQNIGQYKTDDINNILNYETLNDELDDTENACRNWLYDIGEYFKRLKLILPLDKDNLHDQVLFGHFIRELSSPFDKVNQREFNNDDSFYISFASILRNWTAHNRVKGKIDITDLEFFFYIVITAISRKILQNSLTRNEMKIDENALSKLAIKEYSDFINEVFINNKNIKSLSNFTYTGMLKAFINNNDVGVEYFYKAFLNECFPYKLFHYTKNIPEYFKYKEHWTSQIRFNIKISKSKKIGRMEKYLLTIAEKKIGIDKTEINPN